MDSVKKTPMRFKTVNNKPTTGGPWIVRKGLTPKPLTLNPKTDVSEQSAYGARPRSDGDV